MKRIDKISVVLPLMDNMRPETVIPFIKSWFNHPLSAHIIVELVVVNNGNSKSTEQIIQQFLTSGFHPSALLNYFYLEVPSTWEDCLAYGWQQASGDYILLPHHSAAPHPAHANIWVTPILEASEAIGVHIFSALPPSTNASKIMQWLYPIIKPLRGNILCGRLYPSTLKQIGDNKLNNFINVLEQRLNNSLHQAVVEVQSAGIGY